MVSSIAGLVVILTIPALYERFEDHIDKCVIAAYRKLEQLYVKLDGEYISRLQKWILEQKKLSWFFSFSLYFFFFLFYNIFLSSLFWIFFFFFLLFSARSWTHGSAKGVIGVCVTVNFCSFFFFAKWFLPLHIYFHGRAFRFWRKNW